MMKRKMIFILFLGMLVTPYSAFSIMTTDLFFSEYIEGTNFNKALEIYNGTGSAINLSAGSYNVQMFFNGSASAGLSRSLNGTVAPGDVFVFALDNADPLILAQADQTDNAGWCNGDDAVVLSKGSTILDVIGQIGFDPGSEWGTGLISTQNNTTRRLSSTIMGDTNGSDAFDPSLEWLGIPKDDLSGGGLPFVGNYPGTFHPPPPRRWSGGPSIRSSSEKERIGTIKY